MRIVNTSIIDKKNGKVKWVQTEAEDAPIIERTPEEIAQEAELKQNQERKDLMLLGLKYNGYKISFTKDDGDGVVQVKSAFEMGLTSTVIKFDCGTKMPISLSEFNAFALWFMVERNKFFKID